MQEVDRGLVYNADLTPFLPARAKSTGVRSGFTSLRKENSWTIGVALSIRLGLRLERRHKQSTTQLPAAAKAVSTGRDNGRVPCGAQRAVARYNDENAASPHQQDARAHPTAARSIRFFCFAGSVREEILSFSPTTLWRRAEKFLPRTPVMEAESILREAAIAAQKAGDFTNALALADRAGL